MEISSHLYEDLCHFFLKVSNCQIHPRVNNPRVRSQLVSKKNDKEARGKRVVIRNGFHSLLSASASAQNDASQELQLQTWLFLLSRKLSSADFQSVKNAISLLEQSTSLSSAFPVIKLLFLINSVKSDECQTLTRVDSENSSFLSCSKLPAETTHHDLCYKVLKPNIFDVPSIIFEDSLNMLNVVNCLQSTHQLDELDKTHCKLFGTLQHPPKSLNYLGISQNTKLGLGIKSIQPENHQEKPNSLVSTKLPKPHLPVNNIENKTSEKLEDYWEDLENLCNLSPVCKTWEAKSSGKRYPTKELPFLSQAPLEVMEVVCHYFEKNLKLVDTTLPTRDIYKIEDKEFLKHVSFLLSGIESTTFIFRESKFHLVGNPYINGLSSDCLSELVHPLLECGQLVRCINFAIWEPNFGPVRNALASQLMESIQYYQEMIEESTKSNSLLGTIRQLKNVLPILQLMNQLWHWPGWDFESGRGVAFLQYLVDLSSSTIDDQERSVLTAYFAACAIPFLTYLENWIYHGRCCDPKREFFIFPDDAQLTKRDRSYWTNGFAFHPITPIDSRPFANGSVEEDAILGLLSDVYLCGKTVHLLQLCQVKGIDHDEPSLRIGLSLSELNKIREGCELYALKSPKPIDFVQPTRDISRLAREVRQAKHTQLVALKEAKKQEYAVKRSARHALAKAELDEQLELKRAEQKKKDDFDKLLDEDIQRYQEKLDKREADEKRRLLIKYAGLLDDESNTKDDPFVDQLNANENSEKEKDEENNFITPTPSTIPNNETSLSSYPVGTSIQVEESSQSLDTVLSPNISASKATLSGTDRQVKSKTKKHLTRADIKTKVLLEEFGIDPRFTGESDDVRPEKLSTAVDSYVPKEWKRLEPISYPNLFPFDSFSEPELRFSQEDRSWLDETTPSTDEIRDLSLSFFVQRSLLLPIRTQCQIVNRSLMKLLVGPEHRLMQHLEVLRQYLFLDNGGFSHSLVKSIGQRLSHLTHIHQLINVPSMNFILQSALNGVHADDYFASRLSFYIKEAPATVTNSQLEALQCFTLRYRVGWPLNLILTEEVMDDYSQIFSFVLQLRLAAWALEDVYIHLMKDFPCRWHAVHIARHSIYHFVQSLQNYVMSQLLTLAWVEFLTELKKNAQSLDDLYEIHSSYVHRAKSRLLLTPKSASLMKIIRDALNLALKFRSLLLAADYQYSGHLQTQINAISVKAREYAKFIRLILEKVNDRSQQSHLNELLVKLNFNDFYRS